MKKTRKICSVTLLCTMLLCGCGNATANTAAETAQTSADTAAVTSEEEEEAPTVNYGEMRDITIQELVSEMTTGWNLGNTLDADGGETAWGNPKTTHEMIDTVAAAGFNVIRLPTTWGDKMDGETVSDEWMKRVREVVDYAFDNGMYVILNTHHETSWIKPSMSKLDEFMPKFKALWTQIAEEFEPYGDHLLFEGLNEPRIIGGENEWSGGTADGREALNVLNKAFVDAVRATGGNNAKRLLLITTFAAQVTKASVSELEIPEDGRVIVSLHAYTPYAFTYHCKESWEKFEFDEGCEDDIKLMFRYIDKYLVPQNVPVIITEYGAESKTRPGETERSDNEAVKWADYYLTQAKERGIPCVIWDNGYYKTGNEQFGLLNRKSLTWYRQELIDAIMNVYK